MSRVGRVIRNTASLTFIPFLTQKLNEKKYKETVEEPSTANVDQFYFYDDVVRVPGGEEDEDTQLFWKQTVAMRKGIEKKSNETLTNISKIKEEIYNMRSQTEEMYESCQCFVTAVDRTSYVFSEDFYLKAY
ncbi:hypothetical protein LOD99_6487 [Oopsacas minuta]|uniref:Uncharacterized protein n=1 Tax=Oopsacas minuta TaxID=111878 RepID=A0AAV7JL71_9METZ|nr:hypothetical protein LOD99_6487 [Oopsacas minuta]